MCIACLSPAGIIIPKQHLIESFNHNPDGAGFAYAENDELHIEKGFMDFDSFYAAYQPHEEKAAAVHFRITTHGETDEANTHPFRVGKHMAVIHNGIISSVDRTQDKTKSDTFWFNQKILVPIYKRDSRFIFKEHFKELIKEYIGWSKLVFLNNKGHYTIVNEEKGEWFEGVWYSNNSYKETKKKTQSITPFKEPTKSTQPAVFTVGSRVTVDYEHNKQLNGTGTIDYFTGGQMVGVKMEGQEGVRLIHMSFVHLLKNIFQKDDWVVRLDGSTPDTVGEVQGIAGDGVVVRWLNAMGTDFEAPDYVIKADKLQHWQTTGLEEYMQ